MKKVGITIAISGSPLESLLPLKQRLSFDELRATTLEANGGVYTGRAVLNLAIDTAKREVVKGYLSDIDETRSFAFGDSVHDLPILEAVANPFVLGNNSELQAIGRGRGWVVASDEKEVFKKAQERIELVFGRQL
jgi:phosphoserine phosphatase